MLKKWVLLAVGLLMMPSVLAAQYLVINDTYGSDSTLIIDEGEYSVFVGLGNVTSLLLQKDNDTIILGLKDCQVIGYEDVCNDNKESDKARILVYDRRAELNFSITLAGLEDPVRVGENINGTIWLNNSGASDAEDVLMLARLPQDIEVIESNCPTNRTHIYWSGHIREDRQTECEFTIVANDNLTSRINATVEFSTYDAAYVQNTSSELIEANLPFFITINSSENLSLLEPNKEFDLNLHFVNNNTEENLSIDILIDTNREFDFVSSSDSRIKDRGARIVGDKTIVSNGTFSPSITLKVPQIDKEGIITVQIMYNYSEGSTSYASRTFTRQIAYKTISRDLQVGFDADFNPVESLQENKVNITVYNTYPHLSFKHYDVTITSDLLRNLEYINSPYSRVKQVGSIDFKAPKVNRETVYPIKVTLVATTNDNEVFTYEQEYAMRVVPIQWIEIEKTATVKDPQSGKVTVSLVATNKHQIPVTVSFKEVYEGNFYIKGDIVRTQRLPYNVSLNIYEYTIVAPDPQSLSNGTTSFTTEYSYQLQGNSITQEESVFVDKSLFYFEPEKEIVEVVKVENKSNSSEQMITDTTNGAQDSKQSAYRWFFAIMLLLLILVVAYHYFGHSVKRMYHFRLRHSTVVRKYQVLLKTRAQLDKQEKALLKQEEKIKHEISVLEHYLKEYEKAMPQEIKKLEAQQEKLGKLSQKHATQVVEVDKKLSALQGQKTELQKKIEEVNKLIQTAKQKEGDLKKDEANLIQDTSKMKSDAQQVQKMKNKVAIDRKKLDEDINKFKKKHTKHYYDQLLTIQEERDKLGYDTQMLSQEEVLVRKEVLKATKTLEASQEDLNEAEKIFKESKNALKKKKNK